MPLSSAARPQGLTGRPLAEEALTMELLIIGGVALVVAGIVIVLALATAIIRLGRDGDWS